VGRPLFTQIRPDVDVVENARLVFERPQGAPVRRAETLLNYRQRSRPPWASTASSLNFVMSGLSIDLFCIPDTAARSQTMAIFQSIRVSSAPAH
jgi:hypothetical protein